jgi:hypothetical protein
MPDSVSAILLLMLFAAIVVVFEKKNLQSVRG